MFIVRVIRKLILCLLLASTNISVAEIIHADKAIEAEKFHLFHANPSGFLLASECNKCPELRLVTNSTTQAIYQGRSVSMSDVPIIGNTVITVIYDPATNIAKKILW